MMNTIFLVPALVQLVCDLRQLATTEQDAFIKFSLVKNSLASFLTIAGLVLTVLYIPSKVQVFMICLSLIAISVAWLPLIQRAQLEPAKRVFKRKWRACRKYSEREMQSQSRRNSPDRNLLDEFNNSINSVNSPFEIEDGLGVEPDPLIFALSHPQYSARWKIAVITSCLKLVLTPLFMLILATYFGHLTSFSQFWPALHSIRYSHQALNMFLVHLCCSLLGYIFAYVAAMLCMQGLCFALPVTLASPISYVMTYLLLVHHKHPAWPDIDVIQNGSALHLVLLPVCFYVGQLIYNEGSIFLSKGNIMQKDSKVGV